MIVFKIFNLIRLQLVFGVVTVEMKFINDALSSIKLSKLEDSFRQDHYIPPSDPGISILPEDGLAWDGALSTHGWI